MTAIYIDADACPVRDEVYRVAERLSLDVFVVSNGSRPIRPSRDPNVHMVVVGDGADAADHWIAEHIGPADICVTGDIPLAARCLAKEALPLARAAGSGPRTISAMRWPGARSRAICASSA